MCGMNLRYVRENYLKGLEMFGVLETRMLNSSLVWYWIGDKCFNDSDAMPNIVIAETEIPKESEETTTAYMKKRQKEKASLTKKCKNCKKLIPNDLTFCSANCIHVYKRNHRPK